VQPSRRLEFLHAKLPDRHRVGLEVTRSALEHSLQIRVQRSYDIFTALHCAREGCAKRSMSRVTSVLCNDRHCVAEFWRTQQGANSMWPRGAERFGGGGHECAGRCSVEWSAGPGRAAGSGSDTPRSSVHNCRHRTNAHTIHSMLTIFYRTYVPAFRLFGRMTIAPPDALCLQAFGALFIFCFTLDSSGLIGAARTAIRPVARGDAQRRSGSLRSVGLAPGWKSRAV